MAKKDQEELDEPTLEDLEEEEDSEDIEPPAEEEEKEEEKAQEERLHLEVHPPADLSKGRICYYCAVHERNPTRRRQLHNELAVGPRRLYAADGRLCDGCAPVRGDEDHPDKAQGCVCALCVPFFCESEPMTHAHAHAHATTKREKGARVLDLLFAWSLV